MLKNQNIICISSIDWDFLWQGHQEIMSALAKNGNHILFVENTGVRMPEIRDIPRLKRRIKNYFRGVKGIRKESPNIYVFSPIVLPFPYSRIARRINRFLILPTIKRWMRALDFDEAIIWSFLPTGAALDIVDNIPSKIVIYYCIDNFSASSVSAKKIKRTEKKFLERADLVFVTSRALYDYCAQYSRKVSIFPFGVNVGRFEKIGLSQEVLPDDLKGIKQPIIGYVGGIHKWVDQGLLKHIADAHKDYSFVFVGPIQTDISSLGGIKNIYFLGSKNHSDLPAIINNFSACIIPYTMSDYIKNVYPTKLNEYLIMGKPVISTGLPEVNNFNQEYQDIVYVGANADAFAGCIEEAIKNDTPALRNRRVEVARENSWDNRIEQMCKLIDAQIRKKALYKEERWKEALLALYKDARRKILSALIPVAAAYILFFYTPFVWFVAEPLKLASTPQQADAIVVFSGGVGESGMAGQGYEERVQYAVSLYKKGYAKHLIFSSGYMYVFKEPLLMKVLAISLGVPGGALLLDDKARNTYENVKFTKEILINNDWEKVILVSSPYHMRRASLVFDKIASGISVAYCPIPNSLFYRHGFSGDGRKIWKQVNLRQIKSIIHEYLGILYYLYKGYI